MVDRYLLEGYVGGSSDKHVTRRYAHTLAQARELARQALLEGWFAVVDISVYDYDLRGWNMLYAVSRAGSRFRWSRP
jgi:hypothetical protein